MNRNPRLLGALTLASTLVALAFAWGGLHKLRAVPVVARDGTMPRLRASIAGESMVGMIVLLVAAILVNANPPG